MQKQKTQKFESIPFFFCRIILSTRYPCMHLLRSVPYVLSIPTHLPRSPRDVFRVTHNAYYYHTCQFLHGLYSSFHREAIARDHDAIGRDHDAIGRDYDAISRDHDATERDHSARCGSFFGVHFLSRFIKRSMMYPIFFHVLQKKYDVPNLLSRFIKEV